MASPRATPTFRADHVSSFLQPKYLLDARAYRQAGTLSAAQLRVVENRAIAEVVRFQEGIGLRSITGGELRGTRFRIDFHQQFGGVKTDIAFTVRKPDGNEFAVEAHEAKVRLVIETAIKVWSDA